MAPPPLVSVVLTTYYRNELLERAIRSVQNQNYEHIEIVVVDGSGEDHASPVVQTFSDLTYVSPDEEISANDARNRGIREAEGTYIQLLDDDDQILGNKFEKQIAVFRDDPDVGVVYSGGEYSTGEQFYPAPDAHGDVLRRALQLELYSCITSTMLFRRDVLDAILPLPETAGSDDTHWKIELAQRTQFDFVDEPLVLKHVSPESRVNDEGNIRALESLFETYEPLYEKQPDTVYRIARANYHKRRADVLLHQQRWSLGAIYSYAKAFQNRPLVGHLGLVVMSLFGRAGVRLVKSL